MISGCSKRSRSNDVIAQRKIPISNGKYSALMGRRRSMWLVVRWVLDKFWLPVLSQCLKIIIHGTKRITGKDVSIFSLFFWGGEMMAAKLLKQKSR